MVVDSAVLRSRLAVIASALLLAAGAAQAQTTEGAMDAVDAVDTMAEPSLAELLRTEVSTASRRAQPLRDVSAAVFVLGADELRRSGAKSLPDALRLVPGVEVAELGVGSFAITVRGSNDRYANKLLVLVDGRSVYSPLSAGVSWELLDLPLPSIERIEVLRGPGTALWGSNAVNGVINIITRPADGSGGRRAEALLGTRQSLLSAAVSRAFGDDVAARLSVQQRRSADMRQPAPGEASLRAAHVALRVDQTRPGLRRVFAFNVSDSDVDAPDRDQSLAPPYVQTLQRQRRAAGVSLAYAEDRVLNASHEVGLQASLARERIPVADTASRNQVADLDLHHRWRWQADHQLIWGLAARQSRDSSPDSLHIAYLDRGSLTGSGLYVRDEWVLPELPLRLSLGVRAEALAREPTQWQPTLRALWLPAQGHTLWAAWSRASRLPVRTELSTLVTADVQPPPAGGPPGPVQFLFDPRRGPAPLRSEQLTALEAGYRGELGRTLFVDVALYRHRLRDLRVLQVAGMRRASDPERSIVDLYLDNSAGLDLDGVEARVDWRPLRWLRLDGSLTATRLALREGTPAGTGQTSPRRQALVHAAMDLSGGLELDLTLRHVGRLRSGQVPAYTVFDLRLGWALSPRVDVELLGRNLGGAGHPEYPSALPSGAPLVLRPSLAVGVALRF